MRKVWSLRVVFFLLFCGLTNSSADAKNGGRAKNKISLNTPLALYPSVAAVGGAVLAGEANWLLGSKKHYMNQDSISSRKLSITRIARNILQRGDYMGSVSGANVDKSGVFAYRLGTSPIIDASPHFQKYKQVIARMVKSLKLLDQDSHNHLTSLIIS